MAVNEKVHYATKHVTHNGRIYRPGEQLSGRLPAEALKHAEANGLTTVSHAEAEQFKGAEQQRRADVERQIITRSEKRKRDH